MSEILGLDGKPIFRRLRIEADAARLLRRYKAFLTKHGYREGLFCDRCGQTESGTHASVNQQHVRIECRCTERLYSGAMH